jgi:methylmalonyl-CoA mutase
VQTDILKEDGARTPAFPSEFSLVMGDIAQFFVHHNVRAQLLQRVVSGYHIAEAGANDQCGLHAQQRLYVVEATWRAACTSTTSRPTIFLLQQRHGPRIHRDGTVARRIWAVAMKEKYSATNAARS